MHDTGDTGVVTAETFRYSGVVLSEVSVWYGAVSDVSECPTHYVSVGNGRPVSGIMKNIFQGISYILGMSNFS